MDKIYKMIEDIEKYIDNSDIKNAQMTLKMVLDELIKYYNETNLFSQKKCKNKEDEKQIDLAYSKVVSIIPKYKYLDMKKNVSQKSSSNKYLKNINLNLLEFMNNSISVTPKLLSNENFDAVLSQYDRNYFKILKEHKITTKLTNNNSLTKFENKHNKILILTFDDRPHVNYIKNHNDNFNKYAKNKGYTYKFEHIYNENLNTNPYWYKIYLVKYYLDMNLYDYVMWVDSDTMIINETFDLNSYLNQHSSDLYFCDDNQTIEKINAGIFVIKNSHIGKQYLNDCINNFCSDCILKGEKKLKGNWAATCYEQGIMNLVLINSYMQYSTVFSINIVLCTNNLIVIDRMYKSNSIFILHYYDTNSFQRNMLFDMIKKKELNFIKILE